MREQIVLLQRGGATSGVLPHASKLYRARRKRPERRRNRRCRNHAMVQEAPDAPSSMDAEVGGHAQSRAAQRDQRDYFAREGGARGTNVGRRTFFGSIPGELCSASRASRSHVRAMSIRMDWTREVCSRSAICRHSAARSRHSAALIIGPCPLGRFDPTPKTSNVCPVTDVPTLISADRGSFATPRSAGLRRG
jgi:hypothetical protein